jgi:hypothetical protein
VGGESKEQLKIISKSIDDNIVITSPSNYTRAKAKQGCGEEYN